jgi:hypothetical protein
VSIVINKGVIVIKFDPVKKFGLSTGIVLILILAVAMCIVWPWMLITSLNILFPSLSIPFNFDTWCAVMMLHLVINTSIKLGSSK